MRPICQGSRPSVPTQLLLFLSDCKALNFADPSALENAKRSAGGQKCGIGRLAEPQKIGGLSTLSEKGMYFWDWVLSVARCYMKIEAHHMGPS